MPPTTIETTEHLALDSPLDPAIAVAGVFALAAVFAWSLWRERMILGRPTTALFWALRTLALATVGWMLLAPVSRRVETATTRRAIAIVADTTGSMGTVDPPGTTDELRWGTATKAQNQRAIDVADRATVAIGAAQRQIRLAADALRQHRPEAIVVAATQRARDGLLRTRQHLADLADYPNLGPTIAGLLQRTAKQLDGAMFQDFVQLSRDLERGKKPSQQDWRESLPDLEQAMAGMRRTLAELGRQVEGSERPQTSSDQPGRASSRLSRVAGFLEDLESSTLEQLRTTADVRLKAFDSVLVELAETELLPEGSKSAAQADVVDPNQGTNLSAALESLWHAHQDQPLSAVFLVSDVAHNDEAEDPREAAALFEETPVYVVPIGNTDHLRDVILQAAYAPGVAMRNDDIVIEANLQAHQCAGETCVVELLQDGVVIDSRQVSLDSGFVSRSVRFEQRVSEVGIQQFQLAIAPLPGESSEGNNFQKVEVNVTRSDIKLLLADELPRWEYRYLAQLFRRDVKVDCDELLFHPRMIATGRREESKTLPVTVDEWDHYDVVLLGDLPPEHFPVAAQETLIEYLQQRGGTLVLIAGSEAMPQKFRDHPLEDILPVTEVDDDRPSDEGFAFRVTREGQSHHALTIGETLESTRVAWDFVNRYAPLPAVSRFRKPRPAAHTLIAAVPKDAVDPNAGAESAFLCWQSIGRGRIVYLSGPDTFRLRFLRGDRLHYRFWGQLLRWAIADDLFAGSELVQVRTSKSQYAPNEEVLVTVRLSDPEGEPINAEGVEVEVSGSAETRVVPLTAASEIPGEYTAAIRSLATGVYRVRPVGEFVEELQTDAPADLIPANFTVQESLPLELEDTRSDRSLAQQIASVTGGQVLPPVGVSEVLELTDLSPIITEQVERRPLWLQWRFLWIVFGCLQIEWAIRKWMGLS